MKASQWRYLAEGGKHAVFFFQGDHDDDNNNNGNSGLVVDGTSHNQLAVNDYTVQSHPYDKYDGMLLRVQKKDLRDAPTRILSMPIITDHRNINRHGHGAPPPDADTVVFEGRPPPIVMRSGNATLQESDKNNDTSSSLHYVRNVVAPSLAPFVDVPQSIYLGWDFLVELRKQTLQALTTTTTTEIPSLRLQDWGLQSDNQTGKVITYGGTDASYAQQPFAHATVIRDYRTILQPQPSPSSTNLCSSGGCCCFTIEVKPKGGYVAFSPFVDPSHRIKYVQSRFVSLQQLHQRGEWMKGWTKNTSRSNHDPVVMTSHDSDHGIGGDSAAVQYPTSNTAAATQMSGYDPIDLFAGSIDDDPIRLRRAISSLLENPQNNLRIWYNNQMLLGQDCHITNESITRLFESVHHGDTTIHRPTERQVNHSIPLYEEQIHDILGEMLFQVFSSSEGQSLLSKLLVLQKLDVLDVDGATYIYHRMVDRFCSGSHHHAQRHLDDVQLQDVRCSNCGPTGDIPLFEASPFAHVVDDVNVNGIRRSALFECCKVIQEFQAELDRVSPSLPTTVSMDEVRDKVVRIVDDLSFEECQFLLRNWLLSLAMCDVSIFITLQQQNRVIHDIANNIPVVNVSVGDVKKHFLYCLHVIDCDQKPAKKLQHRSNKESAFSLLPMAKKSHVI